MKFETAELTVLDGLMVRPDVKKIGWRQLLEMLGREDSRVRAVVNQRFEVLDISLGALPALEPYQFEVPIVMVAGDFIEVTVPEGWSAEAILRKPGGLPFTGTRPSGARVHVGPPGRTWESDRGSSDDEEDEPEPAEPVESAEPAEPAAAGHNCGACEACDPAASERLTNAASDLAETILESGALTLGECIVILVRASAMIAAMHPDPQHDFTKGRATLHGLLDQELDVGQAFRRAQAQRASAGVN